MNEYENVKQGWFFRNLIVPFDSMDIHMARYCFKCVTILEDVWLIWMNHGRIWSKRAQAMEGDFRCCRHHDYSSHLWYPTGINFSLGCLQGISFLLFNCYVFCLSVVLLLIGWHWLMTVKWMMIPFCNWIVIPGIKMPSLLTWLVDRVKFINIVLLLYARLRDLSFIKYGVQNHDASSYKWSFLFYCFPILWLHLQGQLSYVIVFEAQTLDVSLLPISARRAFSFRMVLKSIKLYSCRKRSWESRMDLTKNFSSTHCFLFSVTVSQHLLSLLDFYWYVAITW